MQTKHVSLRKLRTISRREYVSNVHIKRRDDGTARIVLTVNDLYWFHCEFASFAVLCRVLTLWRSLYGVQLYCDAGLNWGTISRKNYHLQANKCF